MNSDCTVPHLSARPVITIPPSSTESPYTVPVILNRAYTVNVTFYSNAGHSEAMLYKLSNRSSPGRFDTTRVTDVSLQTKEDIVSLNVHGKVVTTGGYTLTLTHTLTQEDQFGTYILKIPNEIDHEDFVFMVTSEGKMPTKQSDLHRRAAYSVCESWFLIHQDVYHDLFVCS